MNTSRDTQAKRQRLFTGYHRIGVVIVPDEDELKTRIEKVEKAENITIPSQWIREAKGEQIESSRLIDSSFSLLSEIPSVTKRFDVRRSDLSGIVL